jgi:dUTPase
MKVKYYIKNVDGVIVPKRANESDAGYDVIATSGPKITGEVYSGPSYKRIDYVEYETNLYISPDPKDRHFHTDLRPRSSISKYNLVLANSVGLIDRGYKNQILARFKYVWNPEDYQISGDLILGTPNVNKMYQKGDKICQLVPMETHTIDFTLVKDLDGEDRGGGFGSTDRPVSKPVNNQFELKEKTTVSKFLAGQSAAKIEMAKSYYSNYQGELYAYQENGMRGLCVIDSSGEILVKTPIEKIA